jgi:hypothetical protein
LSEIFLKLHQNSRLIPLLLAIILNACGSETALLNSERIEQQFGSYGIDILPSENGLRRSNLYSVAGDDRICRTYAVVRFTDDPDDVYSLEHAKVLEGNSLGAVFKSNGWKIRKQTLHIGSFPVTAADGQIYDLMRLSEDQSLALHVYELLLVKDEQIFEYATVLEAHHPDYLLESELLELYSYDHAHSVSSDTLAQMEALMRVRNAQP